MIRFRFREDEKRYVDLVSEVYRLIAGGLPPDQVSVAMRNLGKLQDLLMLEGVRQGVAIAAISNVAKTTEDQDLEHLKAFQLHAHVYGSQDTPLRDIEEEWLEKLTGEHHARSPWLDPEPMRFAPDTERAFIQQQAAAAPQPSAYEMFHEQHDGIEGEDDVSLDDIDALLAENETDAQERPQLLDQIRDALHDMANQGVNPRDWEDLVLRLHMALHVDAGFIDLQLGTAMGRAVLAQTGFHSFQPGPFGTNLGKLMEEAAGDVNPPAAPMAEGAPTPAGDPPDGYSSGADG